MVTQTLVAQGNTVYGQLVQVHENVHDRPIRGLGDTSFSVSVSGVQDHPAHTAGFVSLEEVRKYLHSVDEDEYTSFNDMGDEGTEKRRGLGIPRGMMSDFDDGSETDPVQVDVPEQDDATIEFIVNENGDINPRA